LDVAKSKTAEADARFDDRGRRVEESADYGDNVLIVDEDPEDLIVNGPSSQESADKDPQKRLF
jgi:hypothetical protein